MMRRRSGQQPGMSLFPFLAVLICTMGSLIVLLVLVVQQARVDAAAPNAAASESPTSPTSPGPEAATAAPDDAAQAVRELYQERKLQFEEQRWRKEILASEREQKQKKLGEARLKLGHLEKHIRELEQRWKRLQDEAKLLDTETSPRDTTAQVAQLREQQAKLTEQVQQRQRELASQPKSYAIIPYEGFHGTQRRPIYLECTAAGITIQPAGIQLNLDDFEGPVSGNPLDAALRTIREYWNETGVLRDSEPYPLLLVRPSGVDAYSIARTALQSWDDEFGYELVGAQRSLAFPEQDPALAEQVRESIAIAKQRQRALAAAMPQAFKSQRRVGAMRASATGGFVPVGGGDAEVQAQAERLLAGRSSGGRAGAAGKTKGSGGGAGAQQQQGGSGQQQQGAAGQQQQGAAAEPIAKHRGKNWAVSSASTKATGWSRPVQVICSRDRLVVLQERGGVEPSKTIMTRGNPDKKIDEFVEQVRKHVESWGAPPPRGYWKPMLFVQVKPGAEPQFQRLQLLLDNSGFELKRSQQ